MKNTKFHTTHPLAAEFTDMNPTDYSVGLLLHDCMLHVGNQSCRTETVMLVKWRILDQH